MAVSSSTRCPALILDLKHRVFQAIEELQTNIEILRKDQRSQKHKNGL
jgi:hypothetical protein